MPRFTIKFIFLLRTSYNEKRKNRFGQPKLIYGGIRVIEEQKGRIFYHVSTTFDYIDEFIPRIPKSGIDEEDSETPRICVASTVGDCFTAMPGGAVHFSKMNKERMGFYRLYRIDTEALNIPEDAVISSNYLQEKKGVLDALHTGEQWITVPLKDVPSILIHVDSWEEKTVKFCSNHQGKKIHFQMQQICNVKYTDEEKIYRRVKKAEQLEKS